MSKKIERSAFLALLLLVLLCLFTSACAAGTKNLGFFKDGINIGITIPDTFYSKKMSSGNWVYLDTNSDIVMAVRQDTIVSDYDGLKKLISQKYKSYEYTEFTSDQGIKMILTLEESTTSVTTTYYFISNNKLGYLIFVYSTSAAEKISTDIIDSLKIVIDTPPTKGTLTGWVNSNGTWKYYINANALTNNWLQDGAWYYFNSSGAMQTGWQQISGAWYYFNSSGAMQTGWQKISGAWYYFNSSGAMQTGWQKIGSVWYFFKDSGSMATGWHEEKDVNNHSTWYWFDKDGSMAKGWKEINGQWEMFADSGEWLYTWDGN